MEGEGVSGSIAMPLVDAALSYRAAGLSVIAANNKRFVGGPKWEPFKHAIATEEEIARMFMQPGAEQVAVICGAVSGNLECLDFDDGGSAWPAWRDMIDEEIPGLLARLPVEASPSGGRHVLYRVPDMTIPGGTDLAKKLTDGKLVVLIETRAEKQYFCAAPSPGYRMVQGDLCAIPAITPDQREVFLRTARFLDERPAPADMPKPERSTPSGDGRPGDDFNRRCDRGGMRAMLEAHGWRFWRQAGDNEAWTRPGKERGVSATIRNIDGVDVFYPFTSSTVFEPGRGYSPFQVLAVLEHGGNFAAAAAKLGRQGYGSRPAADDGFDVDAFIAGGKALPPEEEEGDSEPDIDDLLDCRQSFPPALLQTPARIRRIQSYIGQSAILPQPVFDLFAALAFAGTILGRRVETESGLRTNFYFLPIGVTGCGKENSRKVLKKLTKATYESALTGEDIASDTGMLRALKNYPVQLFVIDEFGDFLQSLTSARAGNWLKGILTTFLRLFSSANTDYYSKVYARESDSFVLRQPHVCLFASTGPKKVYGSLTAENMDDGFLSRMLAYETDTPDPEPQEPVISDIPAEILETVSLWENLDKISPLSQAMWLDSPTVRKVPASAEAKAILNSYGMKAKSKARELGDHPIASLWIRMREHAEKLALVYACGDSPTDPLIGVSAARWGCELASWLIAKFAHRAYENISDNPFHAKVLQYISVIKKAGKKGIRRAALTRKLNFPDQIEMTRILETLERFR